jgi:MFS family permease
MVVFGTAVLSCVVVILLSFTPWLAPAIIMIALLGFSQSTFRTTNSTLIQSLVPDELRSRVTSLRSYGQGFVVFTSLLIGWIADLSSASVAIMIMGGFGLALTLVYLLIARRVRKLS